ncbi:hypothetical protein ASPVEDRAFT_38990 [Aspergillus versicolor CBS 583.65]|uniref:Uncharacterized protein n=1 Tax=Aspergillus versicolor CBS 583.65 TaxID=1036611 RepID=A0A1L9PDI1_ASPVE|nr:uncharacterized protein ASPVEDRAFT_38990 [Aspergillus versicolor CBS 583.65]OJI99577.1 hypothetical protein ASPVEDRAFT_38990 [Aspergillus versicolor CBS 583.65]
MIPLVILYGNIAEIYDLPCSTLCARMTKQTHRAERRANCTQLTQLDGDVKQV